MPDSGVDIGGLEADKESVGEQVTWIRKGGTMSAQRSFKTVLGCVLLASVFVVGEVAAQAPSSQPRRRGLYGDWLLKMKVNDREWESILTFSRDSEGNRTAHWISFWGVDEVQDLEVADGNLSFKQVRQNREGESTTTEFQGKIEDGKLTGKFSGPMGEFEMTGERMGRMPRAVGTWEIEFTMGEREIQSALVVTADEEGSLSVSWPSERVQHTISDVQYERGNLTFKSSSKMGEREWESTFEGEIEQDSLTGVLKSQRGELEVTGKRKGAPIIGIWNLDVASERGERKQRLRVYPDLSARYGTLPVEKVTLEGDQVSFKIVLEFGEREFELSFAGTLDGEKLSGELTSSRGTSKVTGTKVERRMRRRR